MSAAGGAASLTDRSAGLVADGRADTAHLVGGALPEEGHGRQTGDNDQRKQHRVLDEVGSRVALEPLGLRTAHLMVHGPPASQVGSEAQRGRAEPAPVTQAEDAELLDGAAD